VSRAVWFVAGAGAGVWAVVRGRRAAEAFTVDGLGDRINAAALGVRMLREEVAQGAAEKEAELRERLAAAPRAITERAPQPPPEPLSHPAQTPHLSTTREASAHENGSTT
jgi:hypothetical protein